jgi:arabinan endo-1,5-alpha-L-arabinosidase
MTPCPASPPTPAPARLRALFAATVLVGAALAGCGGGGGSSPAPSPSPSPPPPPSGPLASNQLTGAIDFIHDPSVIRQASTYYVFSTDKDASSGGFIPIRCSTDQVAVTDCGFVFATLPSWIAAAVPGATEIWAPDISYFNGQYHLYYAVSTFGANTSAIGMATNTTLDRSDPSYAWVDHGEVLASSSSDDFNAIDPSVAVDAAGNARLSYGSFWTGIWQRPLDPATGLPTPGTNPTHLAQRLASVQYDPVEGANVVQHGSYWYLFTSWDFCCQSPASSSDYKIVVGRGTDPDGPFVDQAGVDLVAGGGTLLLAGNALYGAPGGQSVLIDPVDGDLIVFHALDLSRNGVPVLFMKPVTWTDDWPVIGD